MRATHGRKTVMMAMTFGMLLACAVAGTPNAAAQTPREGRWQFSFPVTFTSGKDFSSQGGTTVNIDSDIGFGVGFGYNLSKHFLVGMDFTWINANYDANVVVADLPNTKVDVGGTLDATNLQFLGQWNILDKRWTPFLRASLGWTWIDSNIPSGPASGGCWWDPWYGQVCSTWQPTFQDTYFSYGVGAGVRGELTEKFFVEGSYNVLWIDFDKAGSQSMDGFRLNLGWTF